MPFVDGGFIGVDVFFVISGYLISRNLIAESSADGRVALLRFWGRRIRRLVPALALMIVVVLALSVPILSSLEWQAVATEARAAALYVSNIFFANQATDYFAADIGSSLFLHTWSLGVEEQFYLVWPLLVAGGAALVARRRRASGADAGALVRPVLGVAFGVVLVVSFVLCVVLTARGSAHAFFGLPTRAWEFAVAGLLALVPVPRAIASRTAATACAVLGLVLIAGAAVGFGPTTVYPGAWPLIPVAGTVLLILAGSSPGGSGNVVSTALATAPARAIGRVSYTWYLWHWPLILLAVAAFDTDDLWLTSAAALVALGVGAAAHRLVENPVRFDRRLVSSVPLTFGVGALITVLVLGASFGLTRYSDAELAQAASASTAAPGVSLADVRASRKVFTCPQEPVGADGSTYCIDGAVDSDRTIVLVGDSHARHWKPALARVAEERGLRLIVRWRSTCPGFGARVVKLDGTGEDHGCNAYRAETDALIDQWKPVAVISATSDDYGLLVIGDQPNLNQGQRDVLWRDAYRSWVTSLQSRGIAVGTIVDTPRMPSDPLDCIADKGIDACAAPADQALGAGAGYRDGERAVREELGGVAELDVNGVLCDDRTCPVVVGGTYVYVDVDHLYEGFVLSQLGAVDAFVGELAP
jgi:peptidoglycan/LPS O-acetylase OafA/YrhL